MIYREARIDALNGAFVGFPQGRVIHRGLNIYGGYTRGRLSIRDGKPLLLSRDE